MPFFKYTVANTEGKKLSGTVEAPSEDSARRELNNLGFSILVLKESETLPIANPNHHKFIFEAIDKNSKNITGTIPAANIDEALNKLEKEYSLSITAIWPEEASEQEIHLAKTSGTKRLQDKLLGVDKMENKTEQNQEETEFTKTKIETILNQVHELLPNLDKYISKEEKNNINKKIDKLLRIKNSTNLEYILATAEELLKEIQYQQQQIKNTGLEDQQIEIRLKTKKLLNTLHESPKPKSLSTDLIEKIEIWREKNNKESRIGQFTEKILSKISTHLTEPPEITGLKQQIKNYNGQIFEFIKLYFKEPTPQYKSKVKNAILSIYNQRKKTVAELKSLKSQKSKKSDTENKKTDLSLNKSEKLDLISEITSEVNNLTGWILAFYITYYFISVYLSTKEFGINTPQAFKVYDSVIFKYLLVLTFLLHSTTSLKINFFRKNITADFILFPLFVFLSILALLNF